MDWSERGSWGRCSRHKSQVHNLLVLATPVRFFPFRYNLTDRGNASPSFPPDDRGGVMSPIPPNYTTTTTQGRESGNAGTGNQEVRGQKGKGFYQSSSSIYHTLFGLIPSSSYTFTGLIPSSSIWLLSCCHLDLLRPLRNQCLVVSNV